jgi:ferric-dicitrate binding protein FerR (iron transport regulator)
MGIVESIVGDVGYREGEKEWTDAVKGQNVTENADIHTGPDSEVVIRFYDGSILLVRQLSETAIGGLDATNQPKIRMLLKMGEIAAKVHHDIDRPADFAIRTPNQTASVRGMEFVVRYQKEKGTTVIKVSQGSVLITPENSTLEPIMLSAGQQVSVTMEAVGPIATF